METLEVVTYASNILNEENGAVGVDEEEELNRRRDIIRSALLWAHNERYMTVSDDNQYVYYNEDR